MAEKWACDASDFTVTSIDKIDRVAICPPDGPAQWFDADGNPAEPPVDFVPDKRTTAADLIAALQKIPPDAPIFLCGYEGGFVDCPLPEGPQEFLLHIRTDTKPWPLYGPHGDRVDASTQRKMYGDAGPWESVQGFLLKGHDS